MNSTAICNVCKRSFSSVQKLVRHSKKQKCSTNQAVEIVSNKDGTQANQSVVSSISQHAETPAVQHAIQYREKSAVQPTDSNIDSPIADPSPMEEDVEQPTGNADITMTFLRHLLKSLNSYLYIQNLMALWNLTGYLEKPCLNSKRQPLDSCD